MYVRCDMKVYMFMCHFVFFNVFINLVYHYIISNSLYLFIPIHNSTQLWYILGFFHTWIPLDLVNLSISPSCQVISWRKKHDSLKYIFIFHICWTAFFCIKILWKMLLYLIKDYISLTFKHLIYYVFYWSWNIWWIYCMFMICFLIFYILY